jgi:threonine synthase
LSREKAQKTRDEEARVPTAQHVERIMTKAAMAAAPETDCTALWNMAMKGNEGLASMAASMSPERKSMVIIMPKPRLPLIKIPVMMARGTVMGAFWISSAI